MQGQEEVFRTGFSLLSSKIDNEEMENMRHQAGGVHVLQSSMGMVAASPFLSRVSLWSLAITCAQIFGAGHMQLHVSFVHIITVIVTTVVVIIYANNQLDIRTSRWRFLCCAPNAIFSYTLLAEHLQ